MLAAVLAIGAAVWRWGPAVRDKARALRVERACLTYSAPADRVVYEEDPERGTELCVGSSAYRMSAPTRRRPDEQLVWFVAQPWMDFPLGQWQPGPAFLHARRVAGGEQRLVAVLMSRFSGPEHTVAFYGRVFRPGTLRAGPMQLSDERQSRVMMDTWRGGRVRVYAGQPDPADPSHFTIPFEVDDRPGTLEGWLEEDDTLRFRLTHGGRVTEGDELELQLERRPAPPHNR